MSSEIVEAAAEAAPQAAESPINGSLAKQPDDSRLEGEPSNGDGAAIADNCTEESPTEQTPTTEGSSTYSANTVAAISSLLNDESPLFKSAGEDSPSSMLVASNNKGKNYELSVDDRATAIMSVYRDYLYEGLDAQALSRAQAGAGSDVIVPQPLMVREGNQLMLLDGDLNNIKIDRSGMEARDDNLQHGTQVLTPHDVRKEEIKLATLEKFCAEGNKEKKKHKKKKKKKGSSGDSKSSASTSGSTLSKSTKSANSRSTGTGRQTAASTTAAFRLKADVALRTVSNATTTVIHKATVASRTATNVIKTKYRDSTVDINRIQDDVDNDYDFKNYDYDGGGGLAPPSTGLGDYMEDMEYGISPLGDKGLVFRGDGDGEDDDMSFRDICNDLGVTRATHPNLDRYNGKRKYKYPVFRSKKFRKALCYGAMTMLVGIVAVSIASAITNGFEEARRAKSPPLPDYISDEEWRESQKEEWEVEHGEKYTGYNNVAVSVPDVTHVNNVEDVMPPPPMSKHDKTLQSVSAAYRPVWFDRTTGWKGQTYQEALDFCALYSDYIPCPYEVYCPLNKELLSGVMDHDGESWSAVVNMNNEWVQVGNTNQCELYTEKYGQVPDWGIDGQNNEKLTRHIMCCRSHPYEPGSVWNVPNQHGSSGNDYVHKPVAPTNGDSSTESDNVGASFAAAGGPDGGAESETAGTVSTDITSSESDNVGDAIAAAGGPDGGAETETTGTKTTAISSNGGSNSENASGSSSGQHDIATIEGFSSMTEWEKQVQTVHHPAWFSNEFGWEGTTYSDGVAFCESIPYGKSTLQLCPIQAYCPNGPRDDKPLYLQMDAFEGEQWAPVEFDSGNEWVMVGMLNKDPSSTCRTYTQLHHKQPSWGIDGSKVDIKKHILCCEPYGSESGGNALLGGDGLAATDNIMTENSPSNNALTDMIVGIQDTNNSAEAGSSSGGTLVETVDWYPPENNGESSSSQGSDTSVVVETESGTDNDSSTGEGWNGDEKANAVIATFDPLWLDSTFGWNGGSHSDALAFCQKFKSSSGKYMELCPYAAYCPHGPSRPVIGGLQADFDIEGEQWAPVYGQQNHWILINSKGGNLATSCLSHVQLYDEMPSWGLDDSNNEMKKHIMCCSPLQ